MWRRFKRHKLGLGGLLCFAFILLFVVFPEFTAPYSKSNTNHQFTNAPPQFPHFIDEEGRVHLRPFFYKLESKFNLDTGKTTWTMDKSEKYHLHFFVEGKPYSFLFFNSDLHLFGVKKGQFFLFGTDRMGRDIFSRLLYGGRTSLIIGAFTAFFSLGLGTLAGLVSGYFAGKIDMLFQRVVELFLIIPSIPLGLALAAFLPPDLPPLILLFGIAVVLSVRRWGSVTRQVRGKALSIKEADFVMAARASGASTPRILFKHLLPPIYAHLIVLGTLTIPQAMIGEAALSFLGFGIRPPMASWGLMLRHAQATRVIALYPWRLVPGFAIMITILALNFVGDGLRDAADPYSKEG